MTANRITVTDLFCGAGGSSLGAEAAGMELVMAANHWRTAIDVHQVHFPNAGHDCADISQADPRRYRRTDVLLASPECTNHSRAKGVSRRQQDPTLWGEADAAAERSRATMWDVGRFAEQLHYDAIVVENVVEATRWSGFPHWLGWLTGLGYEHRILSHNSMHHGVPQARNRMYVVLWRKGLNPDLEMELTAHCPRCDAARTVRQHWKNGRTVGLYRQQWVWACTTCGTTCEPAAPGAETIIDWSLSCPRIGDRVTKRGKPNPLSAATRARILAGLQRHGWVPVTTAGAGNVHERTPGNRARPLELPLPVQCATSQTALALPPGSPFLVQPHHAGSDACRVRGVDQPTWTVTANRDTPALVVPYRRGSAAHTLDRPLSTMCTEVQHGLLMRNHKGGAEMVTPLSEPARTMTTRGHQSLLTPDPEVIYPDAVLAPGEYDRIIDLCGFRMLSPAEVAAAMAFPAGYIPTDLTKTAQLALAGNAVTPPVMQWIAGRLVRELEAAAA